MQAGQAALDKFAETLASRNKAYSALMKQAKVAATKHYAEKDKLEEELKKQRQVASRLMVRLHTSRTHCHCPLLYSICQGDDFGSRQHEDGDNAIDLRKLGRHLGFGNSVTPHLTVLALLSGQSG